MKHVLKLLAIIVSVFLAGYFLESAIDESDASPFVENTLEIISELFAVFVALSIFSITWIAYSKSKDNHSLLMGSTFFIVGILILFHALSYPFMPQFITSNSLHKAAYFLAESRLVLAVLFLASVYVHKDTLPELINKQVLISFTIILSIISLVFTLFYHDSVFLGFIPEDIRSTGTIFYLTMVTGMTLYASYLYARRAKETGENNLISLVYGSIIVVFSNLVYFSYEFSGHFLIITGFYFFYLALYKSSVELPYEKLALTEEKLRLAAEEKYRNLVDYANDAIIAIDLEDRVTSWNRSAEEIFGWTEQEIMGKKLSQLIVPPNLLAERKRILTNTLTGKTFSGIETVRLRKDGSKIDASMTISPVRDADKNIIGYSGIIRDITERKQAEQTLIKSKEFIQTVLNSMNDAISVIDVHDFKIIDVNSVFLDSYGWNKEDVIGKTCYEIELKRTEPCAPPDDICPLLETKSTGEYSIFEHVHYTKDGERRYVEVSTSPIKDENGKVVNVIHVARDITERRRTEETLRKTEEKFRNVIENIFKFVPEGLVVLTDKLNLFRRNKAFEDLVRQYAVKLNYSEEELADILIGQIKTRLVSGEKSEIRIHRKGNINEK